MSGERQSLVANRKIGLSVITGKPVYTLPPKPSAEMLRVTFANKQADVRRG